MKRDEIKAILGEISDEKLSAILDIHSKDIGDTKAKFEKDLETYKAQNEDYKNQLAQRDTDLESIRTQLGEATTKNSGYKKVEEELASLQTKYESDKNSWEEKLKQQNYSFLVKEKVNGLKFTSESAKEVFVNKIISKGLPVENDKIIGFDDYVNEYKNIDPKAFEAEEDKPNPSFVNPNQNNDNNLPKDKNVFNFGFTPIRKSK